MTQPALSESAATEPAIFIIFGITGDLAQHRLVPAIYHLLKDELLHEDTEILGISRRDVTPEEVLSSLEANVVQTEGACDAHVLDRFRTHLTMTRLDPERAEDYTQLRSAIEQIETAHGRPMNRLFYLSIPPQAYNPVIQNLGEQGLNVGKDGRREAARLLAEKPFGYDLPSAESLIAHTATYFEEPQIYRIDHYLAKETVQNILVFRKRNPIFANLWDCTHIKAIAIDMLEQIDIEGRSEFYDHVGALRDVVQNHLLQLLGLVTMEIPSQEDAASLHAAKETVLGSVNPITDVTRRVTRAQYAGYREAVANPQSTTETYARLTLDINNDRWRQVPITITTGKALMTKQTAIAITFMAPGDPTCTNKLTFRIQPNEGIDVELTVKRPGFEDKVEIVQMDFSYHGAFNEADHPDAYERVLVDAIRGDHSLFATSAEILASWRILQPVFDAWKQHSDDLQTYERGSNGPTALSAA